MQPRSLVNSWLLQNTELNMPAIPKEELSHSHRESTTNPVIGHFGTCRTFTFLVLSNSTKGKCL